MDIRDLVNILEISNFRVSDERKNGREQFIDPTTIIKLTDIGL